MMIYLRLLHLIIFFISDTIKYFGFFSKAKNKINRQAIQNIQLLHSFSTSIQKIAKI